VSAAWLTVLVLFAVTVAFRAAGPVTVGGRSMPRRVADVIALVAPALLAALVGYETLVARGGGIEVDARLVGVVFAAAAVAVRAPLLAVVSLAAIATATARLLT
jgi:branched-subunit amino acid transport protein